MEKHQTNLSGGTTHTKFTPKLSNSCNWRMLIYNLPKIASEL